MNLLIVDDQKDVVNGLLGGLSFNEIGIDNAYGAFSAASAREIVENIKIDIVLCDIEMPVENGLSFIRWVREKNYKCECIFLTSHAEFDYAKEAVSLESFEYILQPARYEVIEETLRRAVQRRKERLNIETIQRKQKYQNEMYHTASDEYLRRLLSGAEADDMLRAIFQLELQDERLDREIHLALVQIIDWNGQGVVSEKGFIRAALLKGLTSATEGYGQNVILLHLGGPKFLLILAGAPGRTISDTQCRESIERYLSLGEDQPFSSTFYYYGVPGSIRDLPEILAELTQFSEENVMLKRAVLDYRSHQDAFFKESYRNLLNTSKWVRLLVEGNGEEIISCVKKYFEDETGNPGIDALAYAQREFTRSYLAALNKEGIPYEDIFDPSFTMDMLVSPAREYRRLEQSMKTAIERLNRRFVERDSGGKEIRISDQIIKYIHDNLGGDLSRTAIAEHMAFHKDSLTRIFKNETGYNLKDYILEEKIGYAKRLLITTDLSVGMVAIEAGFNNFSHFCMVFKKLEGTTPTDYRSNNKK